MDIHITSKKQFWINKCKYYCWMSITLVLCDVHRSGIQSFISHDQNSKWDNDICPNVLCEWNMI